MRHRIIHIGAGTRPQELRFATKEDAENWLRNYPVDESYKAANYRIVPEGFEESIKAAQYTTRRLGR